MKVETHLAERKFLTGSNSRDCEVHLKLDWNHCPFMLWSSVILFLCSRYISLCFPLILGSCLCYLYPSDAVLYTFWGRLNKTEL